MKKQLIRSFQIAFLAGLLLSQWLGCAQRVPPQGGPKDEAAPELTESSPENNSTNFNSTKIVLTFNEFVKLMNVRENIVFSPVLKYDPDLLEKGKTIVITLHDTLQENTTYVINFNDAIVDITEHNPLHGFRYVFSTGSYIDSMKSTGNIINAYTLKPEANVTVMLYNVFEDSIPYLDPPRYIAKTNSQGNYELTNLKPGSYKAFALKDNNRNFIFDPPKEAIAFSDTLLEIGKDTIVPQMDFLLFTEMDKYQYLKRYASRVYGRFLLKYNLPVRDIKITELNGQLENRILLKEFNELKDSLIYWIVPPTDLDTVRFEVNVNDTLTDTVFISLAGPPKKLAPARIGSNASGSGFDLNQPLKITSIIPASLDTSKVTLMEDSVEINVTWEHADSARKVYAASYPWKEETSYTLTIAAGALEDIQGARNDSTTFNMTTRTLSDYGTLVIKLTNLERHAILELSSGDRIADTNYVDPSGKPLTYQYLQPGDYGLKIIYDDNRNGKWDTGNYLEHKQPEKVVIYPGTITIRSNWDQEVEWVIE